MGITEKDCFKKMAALEAKMTSIDDIEMIKSLENEHQCKGYARYKTSEDIKRINKTILTIVSEVSVIIGALTALFRVMAK